MPHFEVQTVQELPLSPGIAEHSLNASEERKLVPHFEVQTVREQPLNPGIAEHSPNASGERKPAQPASDTSMWNLLALRNSYKKRNALALPS